MIPKKQLEALDLEIPRLRTDEEGGYLGGFSALHIETDAPMETDGLCHGCTINKSDCSDACNPKKKKNYKKKRTKDTSLLL